MKTQCILVAATLTFFSFSCQKENTTARHLLEQAETIMEQAPDNALTLLEQVESPETLPKRQHALWCLLFTQASDKTYQTLSSDSLIQIAISYFEKANEPEYLMKSYYYAGSLYQELGDVILTQEYYLKSLEVGEKSDNHLILARIYGNLGAIYTYQDLDSIALLFEKKSLPLFVHANDSTNIGRVLQNIGRVYTCTERIDSAIAYYTKALSFVTPENCAYIYNELGSLYMHQKEYDSAFLYIQLARQSLRDVDDAIPVYYNLGEYYRLTNQYDSACYYSSQCLQASNPYSVEGAYLNLADIEEARQNWQKSAMYYKESRKAQDLVSAQTKSERLFQIQSLFNYQQIEKKRAILQQEAAQKTIHIYFLIALLTIVIAASVTLYFIIQNRNCKERDRFIQAKRIEEQLRLQSETYAREMEIKMKEIERSVKLNDSDKANKTPYEQFLTTDLFLRLKEAVDAYSNDDWNDLSTWLEKIFPGFIGRLINIYPVIDPIDMHICYLKKLDIPVKDITKILGGFTSTQAISLRWRRLHTKIFKEPGDSKKMDEFIKQL